MTPEEIIENTLWMSRRFADGRRGISPCVVNEAIDAAMGLGLDILPDSIIGMYAEHGSRGVWNPESQRFEKEIAE